MVACAVGMRRVLHPGPGGAWGPLLVGAFGVGLVIAGVFVVDPGAGFPPGAPAGAPERLSWHGILHEVGFDGWISIEDGMNGLDEIARSAEFLNRKRGEYFGKS